MSVGIVRIVGRSDFQEVIGLSELSELSDETISRYVTHFSICHSFLDK